MKKLTNQQIYSIATQLKQSFTDSTLRLPAKVNFMLQKNMVTLYNLAAEIEKARYDILAFYGSVAEDGMITIPPEEQEEAQKELFELFDVEQEVNIMTTTIESFGETQLSLQQMEVLMFMIEE